MLTSKQNRFLRAQAHHLKPVVIIGQQGLSDAVVAELDVALAHHELLKVKIAGGDRAARDALIESMLQHLGAQLVQRIGHIAVIYRADPDEPRLVLPA